MLKIIGVLLILVALFVGFYVGGYLMFVGGILQVIDGVKAEWDKNIIAGGLAKFFLGTGVSEIIAYFLGFFGIALVSESQFRRPFSRFRR